MLLVDQWFVHDSHVPSTVLAPPNAERSSSSIQYDMESRRLEPENAAGQSESWSEPPVSNHSDLVNQERACPLTLGLVVHGLADGLALGVSALSAESGAPSNLSFVVFLALLIHKGVLIMTWRSLPLHDLTLQPQLHLL
jgi:zinc transporter 9